MIVFREELKKYINKPLLKQMSKYPVYGIFEYKGEIFVESVLMKEKNELSENLTSCNINEILIQLDFRRVYDALLLGMFPRLIFLDKKKFKGLKKSQRQFNIESFWSFSTRRLSKFNGVSKNFFYHISECRWRWKKNLEELINELLLLLKMK